MNTDGTYKAGQNIASTNYAEVNNDLVLVLPEDLGSPREGTERGDHDSFCHNPPSSFRKS
jgi:hypothetical protein